MGATRVQTKTGNGGGYVDTYNFTFDSSTTNGNMLIVALSYNNDQAGTASVTDNKGNTFYKIAGGDSGGASEGELWYAYNITGGASHQITVTFSANYHDCAHVAREYSGLTTTDPLDKSASGATAASTSHTSATTATTTQANELVIGALGLGHNSTFTAGSGYGNLSSANASDIYESVAIEDKDVTSTGTQQATMTTGTSAAGYFIVATFKEAASATIEQEGFAFGSDDNNEASHTLNTQDSNLTAPVSTKTLRLLLNATGDPASAAFKLKYQKNGSGGYATVPIGATRTVSVDITIASGADDAQQSGTTVTVTGTTIGASLDATTEYVGLRFPNVTIPQGATITAAYLSVVPSGTAEDEPLVTIAGLDEDNTAAFSATASNITNRAVTTATVAWDNANLAATGATYHNTPSLTTIVQEIVDRAGWASGNAMGFRIQGGSTSTRDLTIESYENTGNNPPKLHIEYTANNELYVATSANVTASGENTTARLAAPSGKDADFDFDIGRRWDDENGTDSLDITANDYTEVEWVLTTQSPAEDDDYFEFRVYAGDSAISTYTLTPKWTIGSGVVGVTVTPNAEAATSSDPAPAISGGAVASPAVETAAAAEQAPSISLLLTVLPAVQTVVASDQAPTVTGAANITPAVQTATANEQAPSVTAAAVVSPSAEAFTASDQAPSVVTGANIAATTEAVTAAAQSPAVSGGATIAATVETATAIEQAPSVAGLISVSVSEEILTATEQAPGITTGANIAASAEVVTATDNEPTVTVEQNTVISPAAETATASVPPISVLAGALVIAVLEELIVSERAPSVNGGANVSPAKQSLSASDPIPVVTGYAIITPAAETVTASVPIPTVYIVISGGSFTALERPMIFTAHGRTQIYTAEETKFGYTAGEQTKIYSANERTFTFTSSK